MAAHVFADVTDAYAAAVWCRDPAGLAALYAADVRVCDAWERWSYEGLAAWRVSLDDWLGSLGEERVRVIFEDVRAAAAGEMGFLSAFATYAAVAPDGETLRSMQNRLTWVLTRSGEDWAIAHEHTSAPIGFEDQKATLTRG